MLNFEITKLYLLGNHKHDDNQLLQHSNNHNDNRDDEKNNSEDGNKHNCK